MIIDTLCVCVCVKSFDKSKEREGAKKKIGTFYPFLICRRSYVRDTLIIRLERGRKKKNLITVQPEEKMRARLDICTYSIRFFSPSLANSRLKCVIGNGNQKEPNDFPLFFSLPAASESLK